MFICKSVRAVTRLSERLWKTVEVDKQHTPHTIFADTMRDSANSFFSLKFSRFYPKELVKHHLCYLHVAKLQKKFGIYIFY